jgi:CheY-like chemotaxis protein
VLVVDDEVTIGNTMRDLLSTDHDVQAVASGEAALDAIAASSAWDVIFCDLMMPRVSGIELYERLRTQHPGLERRVVFMTGGAFTSRAADFLAKTPNRRVEKPFSLTEIERIVREMADERERATKAKT